eukprot:12581894-Prorocentrum_lima.AAC.1
MKVFEGVTTMYDNLLLECRCRATNMNPMSAKFLRSEARESAFVWAVHRRPLRGTMAGSGRVPSKVEPLLH